MNGVYPKQIVLYRCGVGNDKLQSVAACEADQIWSAVRETPFLTMVVVQKKTTTQFFQSVVSYLMSMFNSISFIRMNCLQF